MLKENQPLSQEKEINRKAKPCNNKGFSFRANVRVYCIHPNNQTETKEAASKAREQEKYYSIKLQVKPQNLNQLGRYYPIKIEDL